MKDNLGLKGGLTKGNVVVDVWFSFCFVGLHFVQKTVPGLLSSIVVSIGRDGAELNHTLFTKKMHQPP